MALIIARTGAMTAGVVFPGAIALLGSYLLILAVAAVFSARPLDGPFGYANAKAAFFVQAAIASLMTAFRVRGRAARAPSSRCRRVRGRADRQSVCRRGRVSNGRVVRRISPTANASEAGGSGDVTGIGVGDSGS
jgi:hypothetical protein